MKTKTHILTFFILLSGVTFGQDAGFRKLSISSSFSPVQIEAYQESADKKIEDFYSYLNLLSDSEVSQQAKSEIRESILLLFKDSNTEVVDFTSENKKIKLDELITICENFNFEFKIIKIEENQKEIQDNFWLREYTLTMKYTKKQDKKAPIGITQKIYFSPVYKQFGETYKEVWEIKLGEMD